MSPEVLAMIDSHVHGGYAPIDDIARMVIECFDEDTLDPDEVHGLVKAAQRAHRKQSASWPATTDCDRLDAAFLAMGARGILVLPNAGLTQSDGYGDFREALHRHPTPESIVGYCFFHGQDLGLALRGHGLYLAFGPARAALESTAGVEVGQAVADELRRVGFAVTWDGSVKQRIFVPEIDWKRRRVR